MSGDHSRRRVLRTVASGLATGGLASAALAGTGAADAGDADPGPDDEETPCSHDPCDDTPPVAVHGASAVGTGRDDRYRATAGETVRFELAHVTTMVVRPGQPNVDGCTWTVDDGPTRSGPSVRYEWTTTGTRDVGLTAEYTDGTVARRTLRVDVVEPNQAPLAVPDASPARWFDDGAIVTAGEVVTYDATASEDDDGTVVDATWDFDGYTVEGMVADHEFRRTGPKTVTLTVTDDDGATGETELFVYVERPDR